MQPSKLHKKFGAQKKTLKGKVGEHIVETFQDSGCDSVCVNRRLVMNNEMTGDYKVCKLVNGTEQKLPTALVDVDTPYLRKCNVVAVCLDEQVFDLIIGDVDGAVSKCNPDITWSPEDGPVIAAVSTSAQTQAEKKPVTPLRVTDMKLKLMNLEKEKLCLEKAQTEQTAIIETLKIEILSATEEKENIAKTKNMIIEELNGKLMNLMETKATSDDKTDTMEETMKEKLLLMPEDNITTEKT